MPIPSASTPFAEEIIGMPSLLRTAITRACRRDETDAVQDLLQQVNTDPALQRTTQALAHKLVVAVRASRRHTSGIAALMHEFSLSSEEGVALMCLAEAMLRIPDHETADRLIADKIGNADWQRYLGASPSLFVNAATWGLLLTGKWVNSASQHDLETALTHLINKGGAALVRKAVDLAMRMLGNQFVVGTTIEQALAHSREREAQGYRYSYDMLGEAAMTAEDAATYYQSYAAAIHAIGKASKGRGIRNGPGISVKLSALHPRYVRAQRTRVMQELLPRLKSLLVLAKQYDIGINIDAEEADRLELSLDLMVALAFAPELAGFDGLGFVVQAYQKRAPYVIDYLIDLAQRSGRKFMVRLVKGAYWDTEIKRAQVEGLSAYPVYTRKAYTDLSYLVCAQKLLAADKLIYPQFATHNALTVAAIYQQALAMQVTDYEFQCLHGMGDALYDQIVGGDQLNVPCRIYAPVGSHETLLPYLVRRLLENGANSSFVNQIVDNKVTLATLLKDPVASASETDGTPHPAIPLPAAMYVPQRRNSAGIDLSDEHALRTLSAGLTVFGDHQWHAMPLLPNTRPHTSSAVVIRNPADHGDLVGTVREATPEEVENALALTASAVHAWQATAPAQRAAILCRAAELLEQHGVELMALAIREAGKTLPNALGELREAVDFLRYYSAQIANSGYAKALGPVVCISPWNFPLAIFIGQISAALAAGNTVLAKPAEQTPLIAFRAVQLLHQAGIPEDVFLFVPGRGETVGAQLVADARVCGVVFTGSTQVALGINRTLVQRTITEQREIALIAETGGQNAMIVDSSALPEQVVRDVITSAFDSAGQRCSALRVLCLQSDIAEATLHMLHGALRELQVGRPDQLATDIGPVIDEEAQYDLQAYIDHARSASKKLTQLALPATSEKGTFIAPTIIEIDRITDLQREVFGPVLHVVRYAREDLPQLLDDINASGFGLTLGVHTRIAETIATVVNHARVGNIYVNRNIVGAVVGVQPFGGEGKSGTGPKAGGPLYLKRLQSNAGNDLPADVPNKEVESAKQPVAETALAALLSWSEARNFPVLAAHIRNYACGSLTGLSLPLPGPTGELNTLRFVARDAILCIADHSSALLNQLAAVLATGNQAVLLQTAEALLPADLPQEVRTQIRFITSVQGCDDLAMALYECSTSSKLSDVLTAVAARDGAIVPLLATSSDAPIALWRLVTERTVSINTTAVGGNASLMSMEG
ncbi:bifunctional proline dehydrogenase/L-glutamate gamma-semialdehyde dehydrogenase PutA [Herminiimonas aquatilis]|uniref:Bifunctional protein PutA n=1 Tax=Herminiimonas aquatilis TaxID=345342 RepID=A0ABW2J139_9BURK